MISFTNNRNKSTKKQAGLFVLIFLIVNVFVTTVEANTDSMWKKINGFSLISPNLNSTVFELNENALRSSLNTDQLSVMSLPLPNGNKIDIEITPVKVMSEALAREFPQIKTWSVRGIDQDIKGTVDFTHKGFHGMLSMPDGDTIFIEPDFDSVKQTQSKSDSPKRYISFSKKQNPESFKNEHSCGLPADHHNHQNFAAKNQLLARPANNVITYRLAVAATGEYTQFHGNSVDTALSAIVTTINRVNEIYKRDLNIQFELVDEQRNLIYTNPITDPYTNNDPNLLIAENAVNLSSSGVLSTANYDIGHVFGAGGTGGLAQVGSVCNNTLKAQGTTSTFRPLGDVFALDFVAHELGHQLGASHTFNSTCANSQQRIPFTAVEPGSGTTIMSYAGLCRGNNIQNRVDDYFHVVSINQISDFSRSGGGSSCGIQSASNNENPSVNAGNDFVVPANTPVLFSAEGDDTDGDILSYTWEQTDTGTASNLNVDTGNNALFRSQTPSTASVRFIPTLSDLFNGSVSDGELLPVNSRNIEMVVTARDNKGGVQADLVNMRVHDTGKAFRVTSHASNQSLNQGEQTNVTWDVAATNEAPISCANVDIGLVNEAGNRINILSTTNDGEEIITIPGDLENVSNIHFMVSCSDSGFFNVSNGCLTIGSANDLCISNTSEAIDRSAADGRTVNNSGGGGGGSINYFILISFLSLLFIRRDFRLREK